MRSMTFLVDDRSTERVIPALVVTITQNDDGSLSFTLDVIGRYTGDLRGFFFDIADETLLGTLAVTDTSAGFKQFQQGDDAVTNLGHGANMNGLLGTEPRMKHVAGAEGNGYDAGIEIGTQGIKKDDYQAFSFTLNSSARPLTLEDFAQVDVGASLTSVGRIGGKREASVKLLEHTSAAIDAIDDTAAALEDSPANPVNGNVFANDLHFDPVRAVTAVNGSAANVGTGIAGMYGTLHLNADGSYTYLLDNAKPAVQGLAKDELLTESFTYQVVRSSEATASSTDSASLTVTIAGTNDPVTISAAEDRGEVVEDAGQTAGGTLSFSDLDLSDAHTVSADALTDQRAGGQTYYAIRVTVPGAELEKLGRLQLQPGMQSTVMVKTGERSLLAYLTRPLFRRFTPAMTES